MHIKNKIISEVIQFIKTYDKFLIAGHKSPDGDCVGSQLALLGGLKRLGKTAVAVSPGPFTRLEIRHLAPEFVCDPARLPALDGFAVIIVDASTSERTGDFWPILSSLPILVIDHHSSREDFGNLQFIDPDAPAAALLILELMEELGCAPSGREAELLLLGICTDTGFFRHLEQQASRVFAALSRLAEAGASVKSVFLKMFGGVNLAERRLLGRILQQCEEYFHGELLLAYLSWEDRQSLGDMPLKTEEVYRLLQMVEGVKILIFIKQEGPDTFSISFRSHGQPRVDVLARELGGGGHQAASGCEWTGEYPVLKKKLLALCHDLLEH